jgi:hypothetical protein
VTVSGRVNSARSTGRELVVLTLRNLEDGKALSAVTTDHGEIVLPRSGPFELVFTLEMNVPKGLYGLDSSVRIKERRGDVAAGPGAHLQVLTGRPFEGLVQTNAQVRLAEDPREAPASFREPSRTGSA